MDDECVVLTLAPELGTYYYSRTSGRRAAGSSPSDQDQPRVDGALCSTRSPKSSQHNWKGPIAGQMPAGVSGAVQTWYRGPGNLRNSKERAGFLVSRSERQALMIYLVPPPPKKTIIAVSRLYPMLCSFGILINQLAFGHCRSSNCVRFRPFIQNQKQAKHKLNLKLNYTYWSLDCSLL